MTKERRKAPIQDDGAVSTQPCCSVLPSVFQYFISARGILSTLLALRLGQSEQNRLFGSKPIPSTCVGDAALGLRQQVFKGSLNQILEKWFRAPALTVLRSPRPLH